MAYDTLAKKRAYSDWYYRTHKKLHMARCRRWAVSNAKKVRKYARERSRKLAAELKAIKLASGCIVCGYNKCAGALEFDHVRGRKKFNICNRPSVSVKTRNKEIAKCEIVCANCHAERTERRRKSK